MWQKGTCKLSIVEFPNLRRDGRRWVFRFGPFRGFLTSHHICGHGACRLNRFLIPPISLFLLNLLTIYQNKNKKKTKKHFPISIKYPKKKKEKSNTDVGFRQSVDAESVARRSRR